MLLSIGIAYLIYTNRPSRERGGGVEGVCMYARVHLVVSSCIPLEACGRLLLQFLIYVDAML